MKWLIGGSTLRWLPALFLLAPTGSPVHPPLVIRNVTVLPMAEPEASGLLDHAVLIEDGRISWVGPTDRLVVPSGATERDGGGGYMLPGLVDMHAHVTEAQLPLFLANGVTAVRELNGSSSHLELRDRVARGELTGPRLVVGTPLLTGDEWSVRHIVIPSPDSAASLASRLVDAGYDFFKIYDGLSYETYEVLVAAARRAGLPLAGHIPEAVGFDRVLASGQHLEHVEKIVWATVGHEPDSARIPEIVGAIKDSGVWVTPTLFSMQVHMSQGTSYFESLFERPEMRHVTPATLAWWSSLRRGGVTREPDPNHMSARLHRFQRQLTRQLYVAGVPLLVGTDSPNPLVVPGFGIHDEIATLIDAGIPAHAVLRMATAGAAEHLGRSGDLGVIAIGAAADLLLVARNPLLEPEALREPVAVVAAGRWHDGDELRRRLEGDR